MPPTTIHEAPAFESFTPLAEHQSQTPTSFYSLKPVLHFHAVGARAVVSQEQPLKLPIFPTEREAEGSTTVATVDAYINSENLALFNPSTSTGILIPYPAISLHAIQRLNDPANPTQELQGLYMQIEFSENNPSGEDEEMDPVELTLIPPPQAAGVEGTTSTIQALFEAVSNCSNLHPDPTFEDDEEMEGGDGRIVFEGNVGYEGITGIPGVQQGANDGGLPPPFPGSGGWITAENVSEYFDQEGNWIGGGEDGSLGEGAGRVRAREEVEGEHVNGHRESESDESKRARID